MCVGVWVLECEVGRRGELTALNYSFFSFVSSFCFVVVVADVVVVV